MKIRFEVDTADGRRLTHTAEHPTVPRVGEAVHLPLASEYDYHTEVTQVHHIILDAWPNHPELRGVQAIVYSAPPKN